MSLVLALMLPCWPLPWSEAAAVDACRGLLQCFWGDVGIAVSRWRQLALRPRHSTSIVTVDRCSVSPEHNGFASPPRQAAASPMPQYSATAAATPEMGLAADIGEREKKYAPHCSTEPCPQRYSLAFLSVSCASAPPRRPSAALYRPMVGSPSWSVLLSVAAMLEVAVRQRLRASGLA